MIKRITAIAAAAMMCIACAAPAFAVSPSSVTISGSPEKAAVSFTYANDSGTIVKSVKHLLPDISKAGSKGGIVESLAIHSISTENKPVSFTLRLSEEKVKTSSSAAASKAETEATAKPKETDSAAASKTGTEATAKPKATGTAAKSGTTSTTAKTKDTDTAKTESALNYYKIVITDWNGDTVYDSEEAPAAPVSAEYKDIPLKTLNTEVPVEKESYKLNISVNSGMSKQAAEAEKLDWLIVIDNGKTTYETSAPSGSDKPSASPDISVNSSDPYIIPSTRPAASDPEPTPQIQNTEPIGEVDDTAPQSVETPAAEPVQPPVQTPYEGKRVLDAGLYTVGNEIEDGRFEITGDSNVKVYTSQGDLKTNIILTTNKNSRDGVESYVLTLRNGELLDLSAPTTFREYVPTRVTPKPTVRPAASARPAAAARSTVTPRRAATPRPTVTPRVTAKPKTNPATGDTAPIALASVVIAAALAIIAVIEIYKRKGNK